jgi:hypothetical protein
MTVRDSRTVRKPWNDHGLNEEEGTSYLGVVSCNRSKGEIPRTALVPQLRYSAKERLRKHLRQGRSAGLKTHYLLIVNLVHR